MAQHDYDLADATGAAYRADGNLLFQAIASMNSGATEPATRFANMGWFDTANNLMKVRNEANSGWITIAEKTATEWKPYWNTALIDAAFQAKDATLTSLAAVEGVAGDILFASGTDVWARLAKGADGEALVLASGLPSWGNAAIPPVVKTADETVNNSTTLQDDNDLVFALAANITYVVDVVLLLSAAGGLTPDWKFGWTVPASCTMRWEVVNSSAWGSATNITAAVAHLTESQSDSMGSFVANHGLIYRALVFNGANAGNLQLQWAQNTSHSSDSKVLKHSHLIIRNLGAT